MQSFYDNNGTLLKIITHSNGTDNLYRRDNPGVVLTGHFTSVDTANMITGEWTSSGSWFSIDVPGYGKVVQEAGRYWDSTKRVVGVITLSPETKAVICKALSGA
jgi:hypothetical protein